MEPIPEKITSLFWDVERDAVDPKLHRSYILQRIMDYGNIGDVKWMFENYLDEEIIEVVKKSRGLSRKSAFFLGPLFHES